MNIADRLEHWARATPDHPALLFEGERITYGELESRARRVAATLAARGIAPGDRVALFLPNVPEFAIAYYGTQMAGAVPVSINAIFKAAEVRYLVEDSGARLLFTTAELAPQVPRDGCPALREVVLVDHAADAASGSGSSGSGSGSGTGHGLAAWTADAPPGFATVQRAPDDPAALLYSSGTTGFPKGVTLTQANVSSNVATAAKCSGFTRDDRLVAFLPLFHVYGQNYILNGAVHAGATVALFRRFVPDVVLGAVARERLTMFFGVPTIFINLLAMDLSAWDLSSIRYEMSAAATMPEEISRRWFDQFGRRVYEGYGLTECSPFACYNDLEEHRFGSVGRAVEGFTLAIFDEQDRELPRGQWGEIAIRGPGVMAGYWNRPEDTAAALRNGWLHSGDIGRMDDDGYVYIVDRVKDMINVSGFKVWPAEVEQYLYKLPAVREVAVYGVADPVKGEQVVAAIVPRPGAALSSREVVDWCRENIASYKVPARVDIVGELPKSATGKVLKRVLREQG